MPAPQAPRCPNCGAVAVWHAQMNQWGCDHCRSMLPQLAPPGQLSPQAQQMMAHAPVPPATPVLAAPPPHCPTCGGLAVWHTQSAWWGCDRCRQMLPAHAVTPVHVYQPHQSSAGAIVLKVFLVILMIIIAVVVKVGVRGGFR
jgi:ribosomal protein L37AE/L43A